MQSPTSFDTNIKHIWMNETEKVNPQFELYFKTTSRYLTNYRSSHNTYDLRIGDLKGDRCNLVNAGRTLQRPGRGEVHSEEVNDWKTEWEFTLANWASYYPCFIHTDILDKTWLLIRFHVVSIAI